MTDRLELLCIGDRPPELADALWGRFVCRHCSTLGAAAVLLRESVPDVVLWQGDSSRALDELLHWPGLAQLMLDAALVALVPDPPPAASIKLMQRGAQDVLAAQGLEPTSLARVLRLAVERKRLERAAQKAYATDLTTGLPNHTQLVEHMTHLLALREREPAPMALVVLRIDGLATTEAALGRESANVLRRKVAVRIRAGLRASDVVASLGDDAFAVLLAWIHTADAAPHVAQKLASALSTPFSVAGQSRAVSVAVGLASYPTDGRDADSLLRCAIANAATVAPQGRTGFANRVERGPAEAANDE
ncbi:MAG: GGDEF domain-containing protein [Rubrivivax sp.]|nr:GGDEF domain-containing protein [Rubrivivax sp.]